MSAHECNEWFKKEGLEPTLKPVLVLRSSLTFNNFFCHLTFNAQRNQIQGVWVWSFSNCFLTLLSSRGFTWLDFPRLACKLCPTLSETRLQYMVLKLNSLGKQYMKIGLQVYLNNLIWSEAYLSQTKRQRALLIISPQEDLILKCLISFGVFYFDAPQQKALTFREEFRCCRVYRVFSLYSKGFNFTKPLRRPSLINMIISTPLDINRI